jgi:hypothetical protein
MTAHSINEILTDCEKCGHKQSLTKMLTKPTYPKKFKQTQKVGQLTEDFINDAREALEQQKLDVLELESEE